MNTDGVWCFAPHAWEFGNQGFPIYCISISVYVLQSCIGTIAFTRLEGMENIFLDTLRFCTLAFFNVLIISTEERLKCTKCFLDKFNSYKIQQLLSNA